MPPSPRRRGRGCPWPETRQGCSSACPYSFSMSSARTQSVCRSRSSMIVRTRIRAMAMLYIQQARAHQQHAPEHHRGHAALGQADRRALVQGVPPLDREIDDRNVHHADQRQDGAGLVGPARIVDRRLQGDEADVEEEQDQFRGQARVPHPPGAPHRLAPQGAGPQREESIRAPVGASAEAIMPDRRVLKASPMAGPEGHHQVDEHRHPRGRHVQEDDPVAFALLRVGRREQEAEPSARRRRRARPAPRTTESACRRAGRRSAGWRT
jgi:hypothetical protein